MIQDPVNQFIRLSLFRGLPQDHPNTTARPQTAMERGMEAGKLVEAICLQFRSAAQTVQCDGPSYLDEGNHCAEDTNRMERTAVVYKRTFRDTISGVGALDFRSAGAQEIAKRLLSILNQFVEMRGSSTSSVTPQHTSAFMLCRMVGEENSSDPR